MPNTLSHISYMGDLRTQCTHLASRTEITTDAPLDNHGKGQKFSPTDLAATSLGACMITVMGIAADKHGFMLSDVEADIVKIMASNPRRIDRIQIILSFPESKYDEKQKRLLQKTAINCPVAKSLHPDITQDITFHFG